MAGTEVSATVPVTDHLLTRIARQHLPSSTPVRDLDLRAREGDRFEVRLRLARPAFLPALTVPFAIVRQPVLPHDSILILRLGSMGGLLTLAGAAARLFDVLPPGVTLHHDQLSVDLRALAARAQAGVVLDSLTRLEITTREGQVVVSLGLRLARHI